MKFLRGKLICGLFFMSEKSEIIWKSIFRITISVSNIILLQNERYISIFPTYCVEKPKHLSAKELTWIICTLDCCLNQLSRWGRSTVVIILLSLRTQGSKRFSGRRWWRMWRRLRLLIGLFRRDSRFDNVHPLRLGTKIATNLRKRKAKTKVVTNHTKKVPWGVQTVNNMLEPIGKFHSELF